jgi:hypothetical protein
LTVVIVLAMVMIGVRRQVTWQVLARHIGLAVLVALASVALYLPNLLRWAGTGGAYAVGLQESTVLANADGASAGMSSLFGTFALDALGIDLPLRVILLAVGIWWSIRQRVGRTVVAVGIVFASIAVALNGFTGVPLLRQIYAVTFPWGMHYRLLMVVTIAQALIAGAGGVVLLRQVSRWAQQPTAWGRRLGRLTRLLIVTWVGLTTAGLVVELAYPASLVLGYGSDDAGAMAWLRDHAEPGAVLANDTFADAGIWAPYKAGTPILMYRSTGDAATAEQRGLVVANVGQLDQVPEAAAAACRLHVRYAYHGAHNSAWQPRQFPSVETLRASPALEEVFASGEAAVFRLRLAC